MIDVPPEVKDCEVIASISGGKDSTAMVLALREAEVPCRMVFADTGWEAPQTYEHLDVLREKLGPIDVVGVEGGMVARCEYRLGFPARMQRWCTRELKLQPLKAYHETTADRSERDTINAMGVRAGESQRRAAMVAWEWDDRWDGWVWRPILSWTVAEVIAIHHRHGVPLNPLYHKGFSRVGCWPCIFSRKEEIRLLARHDPARIDAIDQLETILTTLRTERNARDPGRNANNEATFFQTVDGTRPMGIREIVTWARTDRGGRQLPLLPQPPEGGCMRWGLCEPPGDE